MSITYFFGEGQDNMITNEYNFTSQYLRKQPVIETCPHRYTTLPLYEGTSARVFHV